MSLRPNSTAMRRRVFEYWRYETPHGFRMDCQGEACGAVIHPARDRWEADHDVVRAHGGSDHPPNVRPLCYPCHRAKSGKDKSRIAKGQRQSDSIYGVKRPSSNLRKPEGMEYDWRRGRYVKVGEKEV